MSRTDIPPAILAWSLRRMAGDGSIEWVMQPIRANELLDVADMLAENAKLREQAASLFDKTLELATENSKLRELCKLCEREAENAKLRELVRDYHTFLALAELAQPIGHIVAAHGHPTLSIAALDERYRELGVEVDA